MILFVDTNVLMDVILERQPFYADSAIVWSVVELQKAKGFVSAVSFNNVFYVVEKLAGRVKARRAVRLLKDIFEIVPLDARIIQQAMDSDMDDFEDAIQWFSAIRAGAESVVTRNAAHFPSGGIAVQSPRELIETHGLVPPGN